MDDVRAHCTTTSNMKQLITIIAGLIYKSPHAKEEDDDDEKNWKKSRNIRCHQILFLKRNTKVTSS